MKPMATDQAAVFDELGGRKCCFILNQLNLVTRLVFFSKLDQKANTALRNY